jgi:hypothetical protein
MPHNGSPESPVPSTSTPFAQVDRLYLEKLRLATAILLRVGEDPDALPNTLESELFIFRDRVEHALLSA